MSYQNKYATSESIFSSKQSEQKLKYENEQKIK